MGTGEKDLNSALEIYEEAERIRSTLEEFFRRLGKVVNELADRMVEVVNAMRDREADAFPADTSLLELYVEALNGAPFEPETYRRSRSKEPKDGHPP